MIHIFDDADEPLHYLNYVRTPLDDVTTYDLRRKRRFGTQFQKDRRECGLKACFLCILQYVVPPPLI